MSERNFRKRKVRCRSLIAHTTRTTVIGCVLLGLVAEIMGLVLFIFTMTGQYVKHASDLSRYAEMSVDQEIDVISLANSIMTTYRSLSSSERAQNGTEEYRARFDSARNSEEYEYLLNLFSRFIQSDNVDVDVVYIAMYDRDTSAMVYIVDPDLDSESRLLPGDWEPVTSAGAAKFLDWNGEGLLYDIGKTEKYGWLCTAGTPIRDEYGNICAFVLVDVAPSDMSGALALFAVQTGIGIVIVTALTALVQVKRIRKNVAEPINSIADAASQYVQDKQNEASVIDHFGSLDIHTGDEIENLADIMSDMEKDLAEHEVRIKKITAEEERLGTELHMATQIQQSMMPQVFPPYPDRKEFDLFASMSPAREVGGDFYDFFFIDSDHLGLVIADVSGKGIPAALFMMVAKVILQSCAMLGKSAGETLTKTNEALCSNNKVEMFVTVWFGILEISSGKITAANAGHEYPAVRKADGKFELFKDHHGFVIGGLPGIKYKEYELFLEPGDKLFLYTDGVPEATDPDDELFGTQRMIDALNEAPDASVEKILHNVRNSVNRFVKDAEQFDDLTMLCIEYKGKE